jgi:hypothetical protein
MTIAMHLYLHRHHMRGEAFKFTLSPGIKPLLIATSAMVVAPVAIIIAVVAWSSRDWEGVSGACSFVIGYALLIRLGMRFDATP